jgi:hypothetical protein
MDTLHDRLVDLADDAPTGGAPAAELWARGRRGHRLRVVALAATALVVGVVGAGIGVRLADGGDDRSSPEPAGTPGSPLPIEYPAEEDLPDLGEAPGPLAAIWVTPGGGGPPEAVGLVAATWTFGTLPIDVSVDESDAPYAGVALSPDGRRIAYQSPSGELLVRDLVSGQSSSPLTGFETRAGFVWSDATHLFGHVAGGSDVDGWLWKPGTPPKLINQATYEGDPNIRPHGVGRDVRIFVQGGGPGSCSAPVLENNTPTIENPERWDVPELCDVLGIVDSMLLLGHGNGDRLPVERNDLSDDNSTVFALSLHGEPMTYNGRAVPPVVVTAGAPERVAFAVDVIREALFADGGAS